MHLTCLRWHVYYNVYSNGKGGDRFFIINKKQGISILNFKTGMGKNVGGRNE